ncbi:MAG: flagellar motor protein MotA [Rhodospirillales bacterium]
MTRPNRYLIRMILFLGAVVAVCAPLFEPLRIAFLANAPLNGGILAVLALGIAYNFLQVGRLKPEVEWVESYRREGAQLSQPSPPRLLGPMAAMLGQRSGRLTLSTTSLRTLLDGLVSRLDESRDISRYIIGLLIFLGLLGTFWGLLETVDSVKDVIVGLSVDSGDINVIFETLKKGLETPLAGMGTAFSSSLFGLAGSLILGFLDLQAGQAQNRFYNDLEEWLSSLTRLSSGALSGDGDQSMPAYVQALLEQSAENLENLQRILSRGEESRIEANQSILALTDKLDTLTDHMRTQQQLMKEVALGITRGNEGGGMDAETKASIRNLDRSLSRLADDVSHGRDEIIKEVRSEIKLLARTIANIADGEYDR